MHGQSLAIPLKVNMAKKPRPIPAAPTVDLMQGVELWPIDKPQPYSKNPRKISEKSVEVVANSIRLYGFNYPIVVDGDGVIINGHTRQQAARLLGLTQVPVLVKANLSPEKVRAYRLADNRTATESKWDESLLAEELADLTSLVTGDDAALLSEMTGFSLDEIADYANPPEEKVAEEGEKPVRKVSVTVENCCPNCGHEWVDGGKKEKKKGRVREVVVKGDDADE